MNTLTGISSHGTRDLAAWYWAYSPLLSNSAGLMFGDIPLMLHFYFIKIDFWRLFFTILLLYMGYTVTHNSIQKEGVSYRKIFSGSCISNDMQAIASIEECNAAAEAIGNYDVTARTTNSTQKPEGCYDKNGGLWLAINPANRGNGADSTRNPICKAGLKLTLCTSLQLSKYLWTVMH